MHGIPGQQPPQPPKRRLRWQRFGIAALLLLLGLPLLLAAAFHAAVALWPYPDRIDQFPRPATFLHDRHGIPLAAFAATDGQWRLPLTSEQISPHLISAIIAVEDARFHQHSGVDWRSAAAAAWQNTRALGIQRGASTITMQLHRLRDPIPRTFLGKLEQSIRAAQIENHLTKQQILTEYLNRAPFGGNLVGAGAASWRYFNKPCLSLSLGEAALLAGLPQNPNRLRPDRFPDRAHARRRHVLHRMLSLGMITPAQHADALAEPIAAAWRPLPQSQAVLAPLLTIAHLYPGQSTTTLDAALQRHAADAARQHLDSLSSSGASAIALVILDTPSAQVRAAVSLCPTNPTLDLTRRPRSTGSALKPFMYAAAFEAGIATPHSLLRDSPQAWPGYAPDNYDHAFRGQMTAADALAQSRNIPALTLLAKLGPERAAGLMGAAGLDTLQRRPQRYGLSLAIGGAEATPLELAQAYATLARGGIPRRASYLHEPDEGPLHPPCLPQSACWQTLAALSDPARSASVCPEAASPHIAWKTGTSSAHRDAWCAAVTRRFTVVVWTGNPDGTGSRSLVGADAAAPLALRLIASLDPSGDPWPDSRNNEPIPATPPPRATLTLLSPADGLELILDPDTPADLQKLPLKASITGGSHPAQLWWFINDHPLGASPDLWWQPTPGSHQIRVTDAQGRTASARIRVRR